MFLEAHRSVVGDLMYLAQCIHWFITFREMTSNVAVASAPMNRPRFGQLSGLWVEATYNLEDGTSVLGGPTCVRPTCPERRYDFRYLVGSNTRRNAGEY